MTKIPYKHSRFDDSVVDAMLTSNARNNLKEKFTLIDARSTSIGVPVADALCQIIILLYVHLQQRQLFKNQLINFVG